MIADSSFLIALFMEEDEHYNKACEEFFNCKNQKILIPDRVLEEVFTVFTYKRGIIFAIAVLEKINQNQCFVFYNIDLIEQKRIFQIIKETKTRMSFIDYCIAYLTVSRSESLLCYDQGIKNFIKKYKSFI